MRSYARLGGGGRLKVWFEPMNHYELKTLLARPTIRVLAVENAPLILGFFLAAFRSSARTALPEDELRTLLTAYLEERRSDEPEAYPASAAEYLNDWCRPERGFLRRYYIDGQDEPVIEMTASSEKALLWLDSLREAEFVATESRLEAVFRDLEDLVRRASSDPDVRVAALLTDIEKLHGEIDRIRATGSAETYTGVQINERFGRLLATARELVGDFRQVEENFRVIGRQIAERQAEPNVTKGAVVGQMLDAHDELRVSAQGQSFYAFWRLLLSEERQRLFKDAVSRAYRIPEIEERLRGNRLLARLVSHLLDAGEKVAKSNEHMSANLRRVLDTADLLERARIRELIGEVHAAALAVKHDPPAEEDFFGWDDLPPLYSAMSRDVWVPGDEMVGSGMPDEGDSALSVAEILRLRDLPQVQLRRLREHVAALLRERDAVTLEEVLAVHPPEQGMIEVVGYFVVAAEDARHYIAEDIPTVIQLPTGAWWRLPSVLFRRS